MVVYGNQDTNKRTAAKTQSAEKHIAEKHSRTATMRTPAEIIKIVEEYLETKDEKGKLFSVNSYSKIVYPGKHPHDKFDQTSLCRWLNDYMAGLYNDPLPDRKVQSLNRKARRERISDRLKIKFPEDGQRFEIKKSKHGFGLFALEAIPINTCVGFYRGEIHEGSPAADNRSRYLLSDSHKNFYVDAHEPDSCYLRYANHPSENELANIMVFMEPHRSIQKLNFRFYTIRDVSIGEEILFHYGKEYWQRLLHEEIDKRTPNKKKLEGLTVMDDLTLDRIQVCQSWVEAQILNTLTFNDVSYLSDEIDEAWTQL